MSAFTHDELSWLHTLLEGHAEVAADDGDQAESDRLSAMICDDPVISPADAEWLIDDLEDFDDEPSAAALRDKLALIVAAHRSNLTTDNTKVIRIWDTEYKFWIEVKLESAIAAAREAYRKLKAEKCI